jgi:hypothetical protein
MRGHDGSRDEQQRHSRESGNLVLGKRIRNLL